MDSIAANDSVDLYTSQNIHLGVFAVEVLHCGGAWCGTFNPEHGFEEVRPLFRAFAEMANAGSFACLDELQDKIAEFGIFGRRGNDRIEIYDLQIFEEPEGAVGSFRLSEYPE